MHVNVIMHDEAMLVQAVKGNPPRASTTLGEGGEACGGSLRGLPQL